MAEIFKNVPSIEGLTINSDGTIIYINGVIKNICILKKSNGLSYKYIYLNDKKYAVSRLVFEAFKGKLPKHRIIKFLDGNSLNTNVNNLGPNVINDVIKKHVKKVPYFDNLLIDRNGAFLYQYDFEISITKITVKNKDYTVGVIRTEKGSKMVYLHKLVAMAYLGANYSNKVTHLDGDTMNNSVNNLSVYTKLQYKKINQRLLNEARKKMPDHLKCKIPKQDTLKVKHRLLEGETLRSIANDYNCSDMSILRFKKRHLSSQQIENINNIKGINTNYTPRHVVAKIITDLKNGLKQIEVAKKYNVGPTVVCRINKKHFKTKTKHGRL